MDTQQDHLPARDQYWRSGPPHRRPRLNTQLRSGGDDLPDRLQNQQGADRSDEAVSRDHPVPRNIGSTFDGDARPARARRRTADRLHDADGRRVPALDDSDESEEMVHGKLY